MEISAEFKTFDVGGYEAPTGAMYAKSSSNFSLQHIEKNTWDYDVYARFEASRSWTGTTNTTGNHSHTVTVNNTGGSQAHNNLPPYRVVNIWRRTV